MNSMTKYDAEKEFQVNILPLLKEDEKGFPDYPNRKQHWREYIDTLQRSGQITPKQYQNWTSPKFCQKSK